MNLDQLHINYQPDLSAIEFMKQSKISLLVGISGAGKDTIQSLLLNNPDYHRIITHTTRHPRENNGVLEKSGREYHFVSEDEMCELLLSHRMIEINKFGPNYYGTSIDEFYRASQMNKIALGDIDINGIDVFREFVGDAVRAIFIVPPDFETWHHRFGLRYTSPEELNQVLPARLSTASTELAYALSVPYYHFIINDDLERAVGVVDDIAHRPDMFVRQDDEARIVARNLLDQILEHSR
ncbi:MAG: hypothetical protein ABIQ04_03765 [Candidatus Saccharimonadales bacterium]